MGNNQSRDELGNNLFGAVQSRDTDSVTSLLCMRADPNYIRPNSTEFETPYTYAIRSADDDLMTCMEMNGANRDETLWSVVVGGIDSSADDQQRAYMDTLSQLLRRGANPNYRPADALSAYEEATNNTHLCCPLVLRLLEHYGAKRQEMETMSLHMDVQNTHPESNEGDKGDKGGDTVNETGTDDDQSDHDDGQVSDEAKSSPPVEDEEDLMALIWLGPADQLDTSSDVEENTDDRVVDTRSMLLRRMRQ